jgi:predicted nucleic acid-binding protein
MIAEAMLDTNIIAYAASKAAEDRGKASIALDLIATANFGLSAQVLQEFYVTATRKLRVRLSHHEALDWIEALEEFPCVAVDASLVYQGAERAERYRISYWDGAIIAAAERLSAQLVYSEDLSDGQAYGEVRVVNPFRHN